TLECNTSGYRQPIGESLPNEDLLRFYFELGGRDISLGSDAHRADHMGLRFKETAEMLKNIGFTHYTHFKNRKKIYEAL
ncbi:MAG: histidinol phosphate phosphatase, partial [Clostridia bacterium]|nr:histidinol phosphate phosphatase [Clostridia bacterium]